MILSWGLISFWIRLLLVCRWVLIRELVRCVGVVGRVGRVCVFGCFRGLIVLFFVGGYDRVGD